VTPFGAEIRRLRSAIGMTLKQHAAQIGVTSAYLSALEHGHRGVPTDEMLLRILAVLQLTPDDSQRACDLLKHSRPKITIDTAGLDPMATEISNRLATTIARINETDLKQLLWFIRGLDETYVRPATNESYDNRSRNVE